MDGGTGTADPLLHGCGGSGQADVSPVVVAALVRAAVVPVRGMAILVPTPRISGLGPMARMLLLLLWRLLLRVILLLAATPC